MPKVNTPERKMQDINFYDPMRGLNLDTDPALIGNDETPDCRDIVFRDRCFSKAPGNILFGLAAVLGVPVVAMESFSLNDVTYLIAHTTTKTYWYNPVTAFFEAILEGLTATINNTVKGATLFGYYVWSNQVDGIWKWNGSDAPSLIEKPAGVINTFNCKQVINYNNSCVLLATEEDGTNYPRRVRASTPFTIDDFSTPSFGNDVQDLDERDVGDILGGFLLRGSLWIYGTRGVVCMTATGDVNRPYTYTAYASDILTGGINCVLPIEETHIVLTQNDIVSFTGAYYMGVLQAQSILPKGVRLELFGDMNAGKLDKCFLVRDMLNQEILVYYPSKTAETPDSYYRYSLKTKGWSKGRTIYTCGCTYILDSELTLAEMSQPLEDYDIAFQDLPKTSAPATIIYGDELGGIYKGETGVENKGEAFTAWFDTKDIVKSAEGYKREGCCWMSLGFEGCGDSVDIYYSTDGGTNYTFLSTVSFASPSLYERIALDFEETAEQIRFRFYNNKKESFFIKWVGTTYLPLSQSGISAV